jgi:hypothetical protein
MKNIAGEIDYYWKKKVVNLRGENELFVSFMINIKQKADILTTEKEQLEFYISIGIGVAVCVVLSLVIYIYCMKVKHGREQVELNKAKTDNDRLRERLSQQEELQNPITAPTQESNEGDDEDEGLLC